MKLILTNGYPFPFPTDATEAQQEKWSEEATGHSLTLPGVTHFEIKHTVTIEFKNLEDAHAAGLVTGWEQWGNHLYILEAKSSAADGYDFPAIIVKDMAYCGYMVVMDDEHGPSLIARRVPFGWDKV